ncbi:hypothetical protein NL676_010826 [Syzygium grande]|nr:hypothetical protein NL676_010826 [Syzygium grande]
MGGPGKLGSASGRQHGGTNETGSAINRLGVASNGDGNGWRNARLAQDAAPEEAESRFRAAIGGTFGGRRAKGRSELGATGGAFGRGGGGGGG